MINSSFWLHVNFYSVYSYESIIATLCESLDTLDEPEAKVIVVQFYINSTSGSISWSHTFIICLSLGSRHQWSGLLESMRRELTMQMNFLKASWRISPRNLHKSSFNCWLQLSNFFLRSQLRDHSRWFRSFLYKRNFQFPNPLVKYRLCHLVTIANEFSFHVSRSYCLQQFSSCV